MSFVFQNVARVLFEVPNLKFKDVSKYEFLDNNGSFSQNITDLPSSPALFETSEIPSCANSFELSPPIAAKRKRPVVSSFNEHSLGVSMFDSFLKGEDTSLFTMQNDRNIESPPVVFPSKIKSNKIDARLDCVTSQNDNDDEFFMSPPMTSDTKRISFIIPKIITQSTPIISTKEPTHKNRNLFHSSPTENLLTTIFGNTEKLASSNNSNVDLNNFKKEEVEEQDNNDLSPTLFQTRIIIKSEKDSTLEKSGFDITNFPLNFEVEAFGKSKSFNYPIKKKKTTSCLDCISIIKEDGTKEDNDLFIKQEHNISKTTKDEHSSLIDMDQLTQLPLHFIECPSPLKIKNITKNIQLVQGTESGTTFNNKLATPLTGFQTAKGKAVNISNEALKAAKKNFESDDIASNSKLTTPFTGFQTAKGKDVTISDEALKAAKKNFESDDIASNSKLTTPFTGFQTAKGKAVTISDEALKAAKKNFESDDIASNSKLTTPFTGFQTAKGKAVTISDEALKAAKKNFESDDIASNNKLTTPFTGFQTAKGKTVTISDEALKAAKKNFESDDIASNSKLTTPFTGFQTAKGKAVNVSDEALKAAKKNFESDNIASNNKLTTPFTGFQTAKGKTVTISDEALKAAKKNFESDNIASNSKLTTPFTGFQTAKGKAVTISDEAFKAAKKNFESDDIASNSKLATLFTEYRNTKAETVKISDEALHVSKGTVKPNVKYCLKTSDSSLIKNNHKEVQSGKLLLFFYVHFF